MRKEFRPKAEQPIAEPRKVEAPTRDQALEAAKNRAHSILVNLDPQEMKPNEQLKYIELVGTLDKQEADKEDGPSISFDDMTAADMRATADYLRDEAEKKEPGPQTDEDRIRKGENIRGVLIFWLARVKGIDPVKALRELEVAFGTRTPGALVNPYRS